MGLHSRVFSLFWKRGKDRGWDDATKLLASYLLTGPHRRSEGIYSLPLYVAAGDLGWTEKKVREHMQVLTETMFALYDETAEVVLLLNALEHEPPTGVKQLTAAVKQMRGVPSSWLFGVFRDRAAELCPPLLAVMDTERVHVNPPPPGTTDRVSAPTSPTADRVYGVAGYRESLALTHTQPHSPTPTPTPPPALTGGVDDGFDAFWGVYPPRHGKKVDKRKAHDQWLRLKPPDRERAMVAVRHYAAADVLAKDAHRWLRDRCFDDWQTPAVSAAARAGPPPAAHETRDRHNPDKWLERREEPA
jgi:hypothetical protein